ncbi:MAG: hypothetical protein ACLP50_19340 [Solirubrobacteraceae bacterium]
MIGLTPGNLITHLRSLEDAGYLSNDREDGQRPRVANLRDTGWLQAQGRSRAMSLRRMKSEGAAR